MTLFLVGLNHKTTPLAVRERFHYGTHELPTALEKLAVQLPEADIVLLSTCNRTELYVGFDSPLTGDDWDETLFRAFLSLQKEEHEATTLQCPKNKKERDNALQGHLYLREGSEAVRHLYKVAFGLDSLMVGESQILNQVRQAFAMAQEARTARGSLSATMQKAIGAGKLLHQEFRDTLDPELYAQATIRLLQSLSRVPLEQKFLIVGAGKISAMLVSALADLGVRRILVTGRNIENVTAFTVRHGGQALDFAEFSSGLREADIIVSATAAPHYVIHAPLVRQNLEAAYNKQQVFIDLAVPRDIDPDVGAVPRALLFAIDDLQPFVGSAKTADYLDLARGALQRALEDYDRDQHVRKIVPLLKNLRSHVAQICEQELHRTLQKPALANATEPTQAAVKEMVHRIMNKVLHSPLIHLKDIAANEEHLRLFARTFGIAQSTEGTAEYDKETNPRRQPKQCFSSQSDSTDD